MRSKKKLIFWPALLALLALLAPWSGRGAAAAGEVTPFDLIIAMNTLRVSNGLPALEEDPIINAVAQATAEIMAANNMSSHIGDVRGRLAAAGYGGGATVWATENFAVGSSAFGLDQIMLAWSDATHMIPAVNPAYCNVGAGVAKSDSGRTYYVLQAAYTSAKSCGEYKSVTGGNINQPGGVTGVSQLIVPVKLAKPDADGKIFHEVKPGQSLWAIAIAYKITIADLEKWNNLSRANKLQIGQRLFIPGSNTAGYATPTPVGMVQVSTPDADGRVIHSVQAYNTLITIADAYQTSVDRLLAYNGWQLDWPLQIGQKLVISPGNFTPSPTPRPLTPLERLTPASDGRYYHSVSSGETLSGIASYYGLALNELLAWNGLDNSAVIQPGQKLLLMVTPLATDTPIPQLPSNTPRPTAIPTMATPTAPSLQAGESATPTATPGAAPQTESSPYNGGRTIEIVILIVALAAGVLLLVGFLKPRRNQ